MIILNKSNKRGFTIIELLIATAVFSVVLLLVATAIVQMGRIYYNGVSRSRTQTITRNISDEISRGIQFSGGGSSVAGPFYRTVGVSDREGGICINDIIYNFVLDQPLEPAGGAGNSPRVLLAHPGSCSSFTASSLIDVKTTPIPNSRELMGEKMRLLDLNVVIGANRTYTINVTVALGTDDLLTDPPRDANTLCKLGHGKQFCAVSKLTSFVQKRVN